MKVFNSFQEAYNATSQRYADRADTPCCVWEETDSKKNKPVQNDWDDVGDTIRTTRDRTREFAGGVREMKGIVRDIKDIADIASAGVGAVGKTLYSFIPGTKKQVDKIPAGTIPPSTRNSTGVDNFIPQAVQVAKAAIPVAKAVLPAAAKYAPAVLGGIGAAASTIRDVKDIGSIMRPTSKPKAGKEGEVIEVVAENANFISEGAVGAVQGAKMGGMTGAATGAVTGGLTGAALGSFVPGVGTVVGGALGAGLGAIKGGVLGTVAGGVGGAAGGAAGSLAKTALGRDNKTAQPPQPQQ